MDIGGKRVNTCTIDEAFGNDMPRTQFPLRCNPKDAEFLKLHDKPPAVRAAGEKLYKALVSHQDGRRFFTLQQPRSPIFIHIDTPDAEELPWETLWEIQRNFMTLDPQGRWPIARLASPAKRAQPLERIIGRELRVAVVLAAARESGINEWQSISTTLTGFAGPVDVLALVSEEDAKTRIAADVMIKADHGTKRRVESDFVGDSTTLMARLRTHVPNIIHFFCHGIADVRPQLELETRSDRRAKKDRGSITLDIGMLAELARLGSLWLVVLNCCQGAKTTPQLHSLARDLVAMGVPAVVAMRESVEVNDAHLFAQHFYASLLPQIKVIFDGRKHQTSPVLFPELVWIRAVHEARRQLSIAINRVADSSAEWTYPVLYVHRDVLELHPCELKASSLTSEKHLELLTQLDLLRELRAPLELAKDEPSKARRANLEAQIELIEKQFAGV
jgi:hypothetical protein